VSAMPTWSLFPTRDPEGKTLRQAFMPLARSMGGTLEREDSGRSLCIRSPFAGCKSDEFKLKGEANE